MAVEIVLTYYREAKSITLPDSESKLLLSKNLLARKLRSVVLNSRDVHASLQNTTLD